MRTSAASSHARGGAANREHADPGRVSDPLGRALRCLPVAGRAADGGANPMSDLTNALERTPTFLAT
jgi:hypothetical protein